MEFQIEKGIPIPNISTYPLAELNVGESFFVPDKKYVDISPCIQSATRKMGYSFLARTFDNGVRIWRTK